MAKAGKLKLNKKDLFFFIVPFFALTLIIGLIGHTNAIRRINDINQVVERATIDIGDSYAQMITNTQEMNDIIEGLMEEKLLLVGQAIYLLDQDKLDSSQLKDIVERFQVWRINIFNERGIIIHSNEERNIGWSGYDGHPAQDFLLSDKTTYLEEVRMGSINDIYLKFGYLRRNDKSFIQVGIEADDFYKFTRNYQAKEIIGSIMEREDILQVFLVDMDGRIIASSMDITPGMPINSMGIKKHINDKEPGIERYAMMGKEALHGYAPLTIDGEKAGLLSIVWDTSMIDTAVKETMYNTLGEFVITIIIIGSILYYAYRKNKSNVKIAYYDRLTGLPNVEYLEEFIEEIMVDSEDEKRAILFINLRNFKLINMTYGYSYGDKILVNLSRELKNLLDERDILFRFTADRFVLFREDYKDADELKDLGQQIVEISKKLSEDNHRLEYMSFEIAIIELNEYNTSIDYISRNMAFALENKQSSQGEIVFYDDEIERCGARQNKIEILLEDVISGKDNDSFYLNFQPKLDLTRNTIIGFEALARLNHEELGFVSPQEFIGLAEDRMLIYDLGNIIFRKAFEFLKELDNKGYKDINISVNVSAIQILRDGFVRDIIKIASELEIDLGQVELEITESILIDNFDYINSRLGEIRQLGMAVSIDDFGTGFSSFYRLKNLYIDILKIDKYFIDSILQEDENSLISMDIISMAHRMGLKVVAEGVEEEIQREYLEKHSCDIIQGYLISKPLSREKAIKLLENHKERSP